MKRILLFSYLCFCSIFSYSQAVWTKTTLTDKFGVSCITSAGNDIIVGLLGGGIYSSSNGGDSWEENNQGLGTKYIMDILVHGNSIYISSYGEGIYKSVDRGESWQILPNQPDAYVFSLAVSGNNLIAGTWDGIYFSSDEEKWQKSRIQGETKHHIALSLLDTKKGLVAGSGKYIFVSEDYGENWTSYPSGSEFDIMTFSPVGNDIIAGASGDGLFTSVNAKQWLKKVPEKWENELRNVTTIINDSAGLVIASPVNQILNQGEKMVNGKADLRARTIYYHKGNYFAGTNLEGLWRLETNQKLNELEARASFELQTSLYPNPAQNTSTLEYSINQKAKVTVEIVHPDGKLYRRYKYGDQESGQYQIKIEDLRLPSGIYFLRLMANKLVQIKQLVIIQ